MLISSYKYSSRILRRFVTEKPSHGLLANRDCNEFRRFLSGRIGYNHRLDVSFSYPSIYQVSKRFFSSNEKLENDKNKPTISSKTENKQQVILRGLKSGFISVRDTILHPKETWKWIKEGAHHYWVGSKLLWSEIKITSRILGRVLGGHEMTRRERRQLIRTTTDMFRLVPFAIFVIVPFMELLLPVALKLFPNMLPSTFEDSLRKEEQLKKELQMRLAVAKFMQETLQEIASKKASSSVGEGESNYGAKEILEFVEKARKGEHISNEKVITIAKLFQDDLTLPNIARPQLVSMCKYMGLQTYGSDDFLRFQLRNKFRAIKEDDRRILWEGIDSLNTLELREACRERGMRSIGITQFRLKHQLQEWLQLSTQKHIPISLLIMSRAFSLTESEEPEDILRSSMSSLDSDTINEVVVASASAGEERTTDMQKRKLESLKFQEELIEEEYESKEGKKKPEELGKNRSGSQSSTLPSSESSPTSSASSPISPPHTSQFSAPSDVKELTWQEVQALSDLARGSSLYREKSELSVLQTMIEALLVRTNHTEKIPTVPSNEKKSQVAVNQDKAELKINHSLATLRPVLESMLAKLQVQLDSTEKAMGDKFNVLDRDGDGQLSAEELKQAIVKLLKRNYSLEEAEALVNNLDNDKDGKISLSELLLYIQERKERLESGNNGGNGSSSH